MGFRAVLFDLGGVVLGSPLHAIAAYEREIGLPSGVVNRVVVDSGPGGAWSRLERGELSMEAFFPAFEADCETRGHTLSAADMALGYKQLQRVEQAWRDMKSGLKLRPVFHWAVHRIHAHVRISDQRDH